MQEDHASARWMAQFAHECISMAVYVICTLPYRSDQSDALGHEMTVSEKFFIATIHAHDPTLS